MNKDLLNSIYQQLQSGGSGYTKSDIYYEILPNEDLLKKYSIVYTLANINNTNTFDTVELVKDYQLMIQINSPTSQPIIDSIVFIKSKIKNLTNVNTSIAYLSVLDENLQYDFDLKIFTGFLKYIIQYTTN